MPLAMFFVYSFGRYQNSIFTCCTQFGQLFHFFATRTYIFQICFSWIFDTYGSHYQNCKEERSKKQRTNYNWPKFVVHRGMQQTLSHFPTNIYSRRHLYDNTVVIDENTYFGNPKDTNDMGNNGPTSSNGNIYRQL